MVFRSDPLWAYAAAFAKMFGQPDGVHNTPEQEANWAGRGFTVRTEESTT